MYIQNRILRFFAALVPGTIMVGGALLDASIRGKGVNELGALIFFILVSGIFWGYFSKKPKAA